MVLTKQHAVSNLNQKLCLKKNNIYFDMAYDGALPFFLDYYFCKVCNTKVKFFPIQNVTLSSPLPGLIWAYWLLGQQLSKVSKLFFFLFWIVLRCFLGRLWVNKMNFCILMKTKGFKWKHIPHSYWLQFLSSATAL